MSILDGENLDYPDAESEEEDITSDEKARKSSAREHETLEKRDESNHDESPTTTASARILARQDPQDNDDASSTTDLERGSSMEGSDKSFAFFDTKEEEEEPDKSTATVVDSSILIGEAVVSVVTTKSVVNGTISVPTTSSPSTTEQVAPPPPSEQPAAEVTTEDSSRILAASVQTSRSVSGARFLPFPAVMDRADQVEEQPVEHGGSRADGKKTSQSTPESTESIIDKLDWAQSRLSGDLVPAAILGGGFRSAANTLQLDVLAERERTTRAKFTTTTTTTARTQLIGKFVPRRYSDKRLNHSTTAKPRLETTLDNLEGLLPRDYASRGTTPSAASSKINFRS